MQKSVPVVDINQVPLMPTTPVRADKWVKSGKATPFWKRGIFCVRLNQEPSARNYQDVALGIDPGSKMEGYTVASSTLDTPTAKSTWECQEIKTLKGLAKNPLLTRFQGSLCIPLDKILALPLISELH
ncbi:MAG: RRXRR domain-containing protein, partial [Cyanobacteria bacterium P01_G01_bin.49]